MIKVEAIVPAAGIGERLGRKKNKPFIKIGGIPILVRTLRALASSRLINKIIVAVEPANIKRAQLLIKKYNLVKIKTIAKGGKTRRESVKNSLSFIDTNTDFVLIHDGVRPFISRAIIGSVIKDAFKIGCAVVGISSKSTLKLIKDNKIKETLARDKIWEIQTPQVFKKDIITKAHNRFKNTEATDDATLVEKLGADVCLTKGSYFNIKITTPEDLIFARAIAKIKI